MVIGLDWVMIHAHTTHAVIVACKVEVDVRLLPIGTKAPHTLVSVKLQVAAENREEKENGNQQLDVSFCPSFGALKAASHMHSNICCNVQDLTGEQ